MKRYNVYLSLGEIEESFEGEWVQYSEVIESLEIVYKSLKAKDYLVAEELLTEILKGELPEVDEGLFRNLGNALNPNVAIELLSEVLEGE